MRQDIEKYKRIQRSGWRRPKGKQSKQRRKVKGKGPMPCIGYKKPEKEQPILVTSLNNVKNFAGKKIILSSRIGIKKIIEHLEELEKLDVINKERIEKAKSLKKGG